MQSGDYESLKVALDALQTHIGRTDNSNNTEDGMGSSSSSNDNDCTADEASIMAKHGKALREVAEMRDTYATKACDVCEQLRNDLKSLKSYDGKKGFDSDKMTLIVEQLYQKKTKHEDIECFMADTFICRYCADKLRSNKDIARSAFNALSVDETPECITQLNLYERTLIKFCLTAITVVRLSPIDD
jgi:hypothetical protein